MANPRVADIVADGGTAGRAEELIDAVYGARPGPLMKAINRVHHARFHRARKLEDENYEVPETPKLKLSEVASAAGLADDDDQEVVSAAIHGDDLETADVVYVAQDRVGSHYKGCFPLADLGGRGKSKAHVSEAEAFAESEVGQRLAEQREAEEADQNTRASRRTRKPPEPPEDPGDSDGMTVDDVRSKIAEASDDEREPLKAQLRAAEEERESPRQGVLDATEPAPAE